MIGAPGARSGIEHGTAIIDVDGEHAYGELEAYARAVASALLESGIERGDRVALFVPSGFRYVASLLGTWLAGGMAVPLCLTHPGPELAFVLSDTRPRVLLLSGDRTAELTSLAAAHGVEAVHQVEALLTGSAVRDGAAVRDRLPFPSSDRTHVQSDVDGNEGALILYTSGTTGKPKGVVLTHRNLDASVDSLVQAWGWRSDDRIIHVLPLHHTHGIVNALLCPLRVGATVDMLPRFDAGQVWERFASGRATVFMAVPTIYVRLLSDWEEASAEERLRRSAGAGQFRLMVSGSAALPVTIFQKWRRVTGQTLLERYGMTEIGMALSNPLEGERRAGFVGRPLPGVEVRLVDADGVAPAPGEPGEIHVRGPGVFHAYWERPEETRSAFRDGWFVTGDIAVIEDDAYRILGRASVDIIKTGGYKVSALEIENVLGGHAEIRECAVVGVEDPEWGEAVCAALVVKRPLERAELRDWARERLAPYKLPSRVLCVEELPKNAMGKVTKPAVRAMFEEQDPNEEP